MKYVRCDVDTWEDAFWLVLGAQQVFKVINQSRGKKAKLSVTFFPQTSETSLIIVFNSWRGLVDLASTHPLEHLHVPSLLQSVRPTHSFPAHRFQQPRIENI